MSKFLFIHIVYIFTTCGRRAGQKEGSTHAILCYCRIWYGTKQHCRHKGFASETRGGKELCAKLSFLISMTSVLKSSNLKLLWHIFFFLSLRLVGDVQCWNQFSVCSIPGNYWVPPACQQLHLLWAKEFRDPTCQSYIALVQGLSIFMSIHGLFRLFFLTVKVPK